MRKIVDAHAVIIFFYSLFSKKKIITEETLKIANEKIAQCNRRIEAKSDKLLADKLRLLTSIEDFQLWAKVFELAYRNLSRNGDIDKDMFHGFLSKENYIRGSMRYYISESRYYAREQKTFMAIVEYLQYLHLTKVSESTENALF